MTYVSDHIPDFQLSLRTAVAAGLAVGISGVLQLQYPLYALVATVLVTDLSPQQTRKLGGARLAGTLMGGVLGAAISSVVPSGAVTVCFSTLAAMLLCLLLQMKNAARVAGYVCGIVVLNHGSHPWTYAFLRTAETVLGICVALAVSLLPKLIRIDEATLQDG